MGTCKSTIPVIDLQDFPRESSKLIKACEEWGIFRLVNHEKVLPVTLMLEMKAVIKTLMDLPEEVKKQNADVIINSGYFPPSKVNPFYEALGLYDVAFSEAVDAFCSKLGASPDQRDTIMKYGQAVQKLLLEIAKHLGEGLGLENFSVEGWPALSRINKYRFTQETIGSSGLQVHTDTGFFTILQDDDCYGGLHVMDNSGTFLEVDPCPGTVLVVIGNVGAAWSNGRFRNVKHRVICKEPGIRYSIATFLLGPKDVAVDIPPELIDSEHPRLFVPFKYEELRKLQSSIELHAGEVLDLIRADKKV